MGMSPALGTCECSPPDTGRTSSLQQPAPPPLESPGSCRHRRAWRVQKGNTGTAGGSRESAHLIDRQHLVRNTIEYYIYFVYIVYTVYCRWTAPYYTLEILWNTVATSTASSVLLCCSWNQRSTFSLGQQGVCDSAELQAHEPAAGLQDPQRLLQRLIGNTSGRNIINNNNWNNYIYTK